MTNQFNMENQSKTEQQQQVLLYCFNIVYAMKYDPRWQSYVEFVKDFIRLHSKEKPKDKHGRKKLSFLPMESIILIMEYCDASSLIKSSSICKLWFVLANDEKRWEVLCLKQFSITSAGFCHGTSAKELYKHSYLKFRDLFKNKRVKISLPSAPISRAIFQIA
jgi:hypothetical protein